MIGELRRAGLRRAVATVAGVSALALGLAACGDDESSSSGDEGTDEAASAEEITVVADEYSFDLSATPTADTKSIEVDNQGEEFHVMLLARINEGFTVDEAIKLQGKKGSAEIVAQAEIPPGESATAEVKQAPKPGDYAMLCPVGGPQGPHYKLGQLEEFQIE